MMSEKIFVESQPGGVTVIMFNRPEVRNALDWAAMRDFATAVASLEHDPHLRAVVLTGAGEDFCCGGDLVELSRYPNPEDGRKLTALMGDALLRLERLPVPVIGAINGYALGGGGEIALACDMRIADDHARMGFVQIRNGVTPGWGGGQRLMRIVGYARAMELLLRAPSIDAYELLRIGLVNRVVEQASLLASALQLAGQIAISPPDVVRSLKHLLQAGLNAPYEQALQVERELFPPLWGAEAHAQAVERFLNRTKDGQTE
jgi:enoyl-CoA hydratase